MNIQVITLIPAIVSMGWAIYVKVKQRKHTDAALLAAAAICVMVNTSLVYKMTLEDISVGQHILQMGACSCIIPLIYLYFSLQLGRSKDSPTAILLWVLAALSFIPNVIVSNPFLPVEYPSTPMQPFALYVVSHGEKVFAIFLGDLMVALQAIVTAKRIIPFSINLRHSGLRFNPKIYAFGIWWVLAIVATVLFSGMSYEDLRSPAGEWFYFTVNSMLIMAINLLIALKFDLNSIRTTEGEAVEDIKVYLNSQYRTMAEEMKALVVDGELYTDPECSAEMLVEKLHTNRTYFAQMMSSAFSMSFSEYITELRIKRAESLIKTSDLPIAEIAYSCGYSDAGYMSKKFREKYGVTPSAYRKTQMYKS